MTTFEQLDAYLTSKVEARRKEEYAQQYADQIGNYHYAMVKELTHEWEPDSTVYDPDTSFGDVALDIFENMDRYVERLAEKVHDSWAKTAIAAGKVWGEVDNRDASKGPLTHPDLLPYSLLPEGTKQYDRNTARTVLQGLVDLILAEKI